MLDVKPAHFDEGVNGWFADQMTQTGYYKYDPTNYHGPLHMYAVFISQTLLGRNLWALRLPAVLASLLAVWGIWRFREYFGDRAAAFAALAMAVSPAFVFYGRYSIHESWLVFFLLLTAHGMIGLWTDGGRRHLTGLAVGITGMVLTKETYAIHLGSFALAGGVLALWEKVIPSDPAFRLSRPGFGARDLWVRAAGGAAVIVAFYSGFFLNFWQVTGLWETFAAWFRTGVEAAGHEKEGHQIGFLNYYWLELIAHHEWASLLGLAACFVCVGRADARVRYLAIVGGGVLLAYSLIPYKTPWCIISLLWPFLLTAGWWMAGRPGWLFVLTGVVVVGGGLTSSVLLNFRHFANDRHPYVYVQTDPQIETAIGPLLRKAAEDPRFYHAPGRVILSSYYPLPWILGGFTAVGYYGETNIAERIDAAFVICSKENADRIQAALSGPYFRRDFHLRSGMEECSVFFRAAEFGRMLGGAPNVAGPQPPPP